MALIGCDGFDSYAATADLTKKWYVAQSGWAWNATAGRTGGGGLVGTGAGGAYIYAVPNITQAENVHAFWVKFSAAPASAGWFAGGIQSTYVAGLGLIVNTDGTIRHNNGGNGPISLCDNLWHWIEADINNAGYGLQSVYVDGVSYAVGSSSFGGTSILTWGFATVAGITVTIDDAFMYDNTGVAPLLSNFPIGPRQITTLRPVSDGVCTFTGLSSGSSHYSLVNETNPDGSASYVSDGVSGDQDLYNYADLTYSPTGITGVMVNNYIANPNVGAINFQNVCKSGATTVATGNNAVPVNYRTVQAAINTDPNTSAAWGVAGLNAAQFGIKVP